MILGLQGISISPVVLSGLVPRLFDQIRIFTWFHFPLEIKTFLRREKLRKVAWVSYCSNNLWPWLSEKTVLCDFRDSGGHTKILISLFFAFSDLSTVRLAEIAVFSKIMREKSVFKSSEKRCLQKVIILAWNWNKKISKW